MRRVSGALPPRRFAAGCRVLAALACLLVAPLAARGQDFGVEAGLELTAPVLQQLQRLQDAWESWKEAYERDDEAAAENALEQLLAITEEVGMERLPDLSNAAAAAAVHSAQQGKFTRSAWALEAAQRLDPDRPETAFAEAAIARLRDDGLGTMASVYRGYLRLLRMPLERHLWLQNLILWLVFSVLLASGLFVALQMATKGGALYADLVRLVAPRMPSPWADLVVVALLLWPLALPSGLLWLALYWSVLLWSYGSVSEKAVLIALWLVVGGVPLLVSYQQRAVQLTLAPPVRALDHLLAGRLDGAFFSDFGVLRALTPESREMHLLVADLHRRFGQWEHARSRYSELLNGDGLEGQAAAAALNNLGIYHHRKKDYATAVNYFRQATQADPGLAEAYFNLAQAYSQLYKFAESNQAMDDAKALDRERVSRWANPDLAVEESAVGVEGGLALHETIRHELDRAWFSDEGQPGLWNLWRRHLSLSMSVAAILLAVAFGQLRGQAGALVPETPAPGRWLRVLVPGLPSARAGRGGRALLALLLPAGLLMLPLVRELGFRPTLAYDPSFELPTAVCAGGLALLFLARLLSERKA